MSAAPADAEDADAAAVAARLRDAPFVRIVAVADGDALAASGVLARALGERSTPFQIRIDAVPALVDAETADDLVVGVGVPGADLDLAGGDRPASLVASEAVRDLGLDPDPVLALAGVAAADRPIDAGEAATLIEAAERRTTVERRSGLGLPTADLADGLAHSTLVHAPSSGDPEAARDALDDLGLPDAPTADDRRRLASWLSLRTTEGAPKRSVDAVERVLRPHATPDGRFATIEGFGDVLDAVARERPGAGVALAIGDASRAATVRAWREHALAVHGALRAARTARREGFLLVDVDEGHPGRLTTVARLALDYRSPEPVALVVGDGAAAAAGAADGSALDRAMREAVRTVDASGTSAGDSRRASARVEADDELTASRFATAFGEAL